MAEAKRPGSGEGGSSRRDFLKRSAVAGGVIWAAPAVTSVSRAFAQQAGSPIGRICTEAGCFGTGWGLSQDVINPGVFPATAGSPCPGTCFVDVNINPGPPSSSFPIHARSGTFCGCHTFTPGAPNTDSGTCRSEGRIETLKLAVWRGLFTILGVPASSDLEIEAEVLESHTQQVCPFCGVTRGSDIVELRIRDPRTGTFFGVGNSQSPNTCVVNSTLFPGFRIIANEQGCSDGTHPGGSGLWYTAALHIQLPDSTPSQFGRHIFLGYSAVRQDACGPCVPTPPPPASQCLLPI